MQYLTLIIAIVLGAVIVGGTVIYFLRARFRETVESAPTNLASAAAPVAVAEEVKAIGNQIEQAMSEQRMQGETQRQLLAQKLDSVRQTIEAQRNHVDGLRSEMRHESKRRDHEMDEIRSQIGTIQSTLSLPPSDQRALPASVSESAPAPEPVAAEEPSPEIAFEPSGFETISFSDPASESVEAASFEAEPFEMPTFEAPSFQSVSFETPSFEPDSFAPEAFETDSPCADAFEAALPQPETEAEPVDPFGQITFGDSTAPPSATSEAPTAAPVDEPATFEAWTPAPPANAPTFAEPTFAEATFEDVSFAPQVSPDNTPEFDTPAFEETAFADASFSPTPQDAPAPAPVEDTFAETRFAEMAHPAPIEESTPPSVAPMIDEPTFDAVPTHEFDAPAAEVECPEPIESPSAFELVTFDAPPAMSPAPPAAPAPAGTSAPAVAPAPSIDPSWIARPDRPDPSDLGAEDVPEMASADEFFSLEPTESTPSTPRAGSPASEEPSGLIDMDALAAPAPPPSLAPAPAPTPIPTPEPVVQTPPAAPVPAPVAPAEVAEPVVEAPAPVAEVPAPTGGTGETAPFVAPEGAEDLTVITSIDENLQRLLYLEGVTTLEEIAQWGRTRARQIAVAVEISEETIMNQWVFEAQAAMFDQFSGS